eukprot:gene229-8_t
MATSAPAAAAAAAATKKLATDVFFVTGNAMKLREVQLYLAESAGLPVDLRSIKLDLPELQGEPAEIARKKCMEAYRRIKKERDATSESRPFLIFTEDTSLCYTSLKGMPGPYIKWFLEKLGHEGLNNLLHAYEDKSAYAQTIFACTGTSLQEGGSAESGETAQVGGETANNDSRPEKEDDREKRLVKTFVGQTMGNIVPPRGEEYKAGWDPVFEPNDGQEEGGLPRKTYAEMLPAEKNKISHRGRSLAKLVDFLKEELAA